MEDWMYTEEKMRLRGDCFRALKHYLEEHSREVYEFCHEWVLRGNENVKDAELDFVQYVLDKRDYNISILEKSYSL